jgi:hypothetical protein
VSQQLPYHQNCSNLDAKTYPFASHPGVNIRKIRTVMKNLIFICLLLCTLTATAQDVIRQRNCTNPSISAQVDSLKKSFEQHGFVVLKEASMSMESEYEMPVIVPMTQGGWYHIVYVGEPTSRIHEVRMFDYDEKQVFYKKLWGNSEGNIISYGYQPNHSEWHMIKPVQVNKGKKDCCGYIILLKKVKGSNEMTTIPSK